MISCANKILSRSNNILSCRNELKYKTRMSRLGFRTFYKLKTKILEDAKSQEDGILKLNI